jgi:hypothetical protein
MMEDRMMKVCLLYNTHTTDYDDWDSIEKWTVKAIDEVMNESHVWHEITEEEWSLLKKLRTSSRKRKLERKFDANVMIITYAELKKQRDSLSGGTFSIEEYMEEGRKLIEEEERKVKLAEQRKKERERKKKEKEREKEIAQLEELRRKYEYKEVKEIV